MQFKPIFLSGSLAVFKFRISVPAFVKTSTGKRNFGQLLAAVGGEMRPNYLKYTLQSDFLQISRPFRWRREAPSKHFPPTNPLRSARAGAPRGLKMREPFLSKTIEQNQTKEVSPATARSARHTTKKYSLLFSSCARPIFSSKKEENIFLRDSALNESGRWWGFNADSVLPNYSLGIWIFVKPRPISRPQKGVWGMNAGEIRFRFFLAAT